MTEALIVVGLIALAVAGFITTIAAGFAVIGGGCLALGLVRWRRGVQ